MINIQNGLSMWSLTKNLFKVGVSALMVIYSLLLLVKTIKLGGRIIAFICCYCFYYFVLHGIFQIGSVEELDWLGTKNNPCDIVRNSFVTDDGDMYAWYNVCEDKVVKILHNRKIIIKDASQKINIKEFDDLELEAKRRLHENILENQKLAVRWKEINESYNKIFLCGKDPPVGMSRYLIPSGNCELTNQEYETASERYLFISIQLCLSEKDLHIKRLRGGHTASTYNDFCSKYFEDHPEVAAEEVALFNKLMGITPIPYNKDMPNE